MKNKTEDRRATDLRLFAETQIKQAAQLEAYAARLYADAARSLADAALLDAQAEITEGAQNNP